MNMSAPLQRPNHTAIQPFNNSWRMLRTLANWRIGELPQIEIPMKDNKIKEFFLSSWAIDNRTAVYILTIIITLAGYFTYQSLPKEQFPEIKLSQIIVQTFYPGTSPAN